MTPTIDIEDSSQLVMYLRDTGRIGSREEPIVKKLSGGVSNKTVWLQRSRGQAWVIKQALPKLRVRSDWFSDPARIDIEANGLRYLPRVAPKGSITPLVFQDTAQNLFSGGKHAFGQVAIQDVLVVPSPGSSVAASLAVIYDVYQAAAEIIAKRYNARALTAAEGDWLRRSKPALKCWKQPRNQSNLQDTN